MRHVSIIFDVEKFFQRATFETRFLKRSLRRLTGSDKNERENSSVVVEIRGLANERKVNSRAGNVILVTIKKDGTNTGDGQGEDSGKRRSAWYSRRKFRRYSRRGRDWIYAEV